MDVTRFDLATKSLARRLSRRTALRTAGIGVAGTAAVVAGLRATAAQDGTATPAPEDVLTNDAFLFVQSATSGTFTANPGASTPTPGGTAVPGGGADYLLTLEGHTGNTIYFSDRPERIFGEAPTQQFVDGLHFTPDNPPNAALVTSDTNGNEDILVVELLDPRVDAGAGTITYGVNILSDYEGGLDFVAARQQDEDLAPSFGAASLFIDDCPDIVNCYTPDVGDGTTNVGPVPGGPIGACWTWHELGCAPCNGNSVDFYNELCTNTYPSGCPHGCVVWTG